MGELSIHRWKGFELYPVINKKTVVLLICGQTLAELCLIWHLVLWWGLVGRRWLVQSIYQLKDTKSLHHSQGSE
jgi:hypothetical protein